MDFLEKIGIIIPSFEPDEKLLSIVGDLHKQNFQNLILINDGSSDEYDHFFEDASVKYGCVVLRHHVNQGKGRALKTAFNYILNERPELVGAVTVDSDGQHRVHDIEKCCKALLENEDKLIMGCRDFFSKEKKIPFRSKFGNVMTHIVLKLLCGINLSDTQTGLRGFSRDLMRNFLKIKGERFEYEMNMILDAKEKNIQLLEVPIETVYIEENASSHFNPLLDSMRIYAVFFKFIFSSVSSFIVDIIVFAFLLNCFSGVLSETNTIVMATYSARVISALFNYMLNKNKVFKSKANGTKTLIRYAMLCIIQVTLSAIAVSKLFVLFKVNETLIKIIVDVILFFLSFKIQRNWVFKE